MSDVSVPSATETEAVRIVNSYIGWSAGAGLLPIPVADLAAITAIQIKMLHSLSKVYNVPFHRDLAKNIIGALVGSVTPFALATPAASLVKLIPGVGSYIGGLTLPAIAGASTYALGKVFIQHFESGGTFLNLVPSSVAQYYQSHFESHRASETAAAPEADKKAPAKQSAAA